MSRSAEVEIEGILRYRDRCEEVAVVMVRFLEIEEASFAENDATNDGGRGRILDARGQDVVDVKIRLSIFMVELQYVRHLRARRGVIRIGGAAVSISAYANRYPCAKHLCTEGVGQFFHLIVVNRFWGRAVAGRERENGDKEHEEKSQTAEIGHRTIITKMEAKTTRRKRDTAFIERTGL